MKKRGKIILVDVFIFGVVLGLLAVFVPEYFSDEAKLGRIGYSEDEVAEILELSKENRTRILKENYYASDLVEIMRGEGFDEIKLFDYISAKNSKNLGVNDTIFVVNNGYFDESLEYNEKTLEIMREEYYIHARLSRYITYNGENARNTVERVNADRDYEYFTNVVPTNTDDGYLKLANKYHNLDENYVPENLVDVSTKYSSAGRQLEQKTYEAYEKMYASAAEAGMQLWINSTYRSYAVQKQLYESYSANYGQEEAEKMSARAGFSEHQTGLAIDIVNIAGGNNGRGGFENTAEFAWLTENAHRFGFILRYDEDWQDLTGYMYEPWHYRYVGEEIAQIIHEKHITFEEYYAYYIEK